MHNTNGQFALKEDLQSFGNMTIMNRINLTKDTHIGVDIYQQDIINYLVGFDSKISKKWAIKAKVGSCADFEMAVRYSPIEQLKFVLGIKGEYHDVIERQNCSIGFGIEGTFM